MTPLGSIARCPPATYDYPLIYHSSTLGWEALDLVPQGKDRWEIQTLSLKPFPTDMLSSPSCSRGWLNLIFLGCRFVMGITQFPWPKRRAGGQRFHHFEMHFGKLKTMSYLVCKDSFLQSLQKSLLDILHLTPLSSLVVFPCPGDLAEHHWWFFMCHLWAWLCPPSSCFCSLFIHPWSLLIHEGHFIFNDGFTNV